MKSEPKVLIAPSAYKGSISPREVAEAIGRGVTATLPKARLTIAPMADGGDGTMAVLQENFGWQFERLTASDALGIKRECPYLRGPNFVMLELSAICGLALLKERRAALSASTYGLGQAISQVLTLSGNIEKIYVTVGGSASTDGGAGALEALGFHFTDESKKSVPHGGGFLKLIENVSFDSPASIFTSPPIHVVTDVDNPLLGDFGAAQIYGPQKGASASDVEILEEGLLHFADKLEKFTGRKVRDLPGAGAAGGTAFGLCCALGAEIVPGARAIATLIELESKVENADLVFTGEGALDLQSLMGKATGYIRDLCIRYNKPFFIVPAFVDPQFEWRSHNVTGVKQALVRGDTATVDDITEATKAILHDYL